jgi:hypothetical protein
VAKAAGSVTPTKEGSVSDCSSNAFVQRRTAGFHEMFEQNWKRPRALKVRATNGRDSQLCRKTGVIKPPSRDLETQKKYNHMNLLMFLYP